MEGVTEVLTLRFSFYALNSIAFYAVVGTAEFS
jgi:hypothetical protein